MDTITSQKSQKIKDPRRVASGKRLAAISKDAKRAKKDRETAEQQYDDDDDTNERSSFNFGYVVGVIGVITGVGALYFAYQQNKFQDTSPPPPPPPQHTTTPSKPTTRSNTEYFD